MDLVFTLNEIHGRNCHVNGSKCVGNWDTSNVKDFLTYLRDNKVGPIFGFELGNELTTNNYHMNIEENIADYITLGKIIAEIWPDIRSRPALYGPSNDHCSEDTQTFMTATKSFLAGFTYHSYPGQSGSQLKTQLLSIDWLKQNIIEKDIGGNSSYCIQAWKQIGQPVGMKLWVTETNSAYNGVDGVLNAFYNSFWYLASLGQYAKTGVERHCRWALHGGDPTTFVNTSHGTYSAVPDYWTAVLYKRLIGTNVLSTSGAFSEALVYAHCGKIQGAVTVIVINPSTSGVTLDISGISSAVPRDEYILTSPSLDSYVVQLNGKSLALNLDGSLPDLTPHTITDGDIILPPYSHGFIVFPKAAAQVCQ